MEKARAFARRPERGDTWWLILCTNPSEILDTKVQGEVPIEIREQEAGDFSAMHLHRVTTIAPRKKTALPLISASLPEPLHSSYILMTERKLIFSDLGKLLKLSNHQTLNVCILTILEMSDLRDLLL